MKNKKITCIALALLTGSVSQLAMGAKDKEMKMSSDRDTLSATQQVTRVSDDRIDELTTASDLIGASVYDRNGDKVGDIKDVSFGRDLMSTMSTGQKSWDSKSSDKMRDKMSNEEKERKSDSYASNKDSKDWSSDKNADGMKRAHDRMTTNGRPEAVVFISVGGLFGIGDDLVQVPASKLSYDASQEHFVLQGHTVEQVTEIAEVDDADFNAEDYYTDNWYEVNMYGVYVDPQATTTSRAKLDYGSDEEMIRNAFKDDSTLAASADRIDINMKDDQLVLMGTVNSKEAKQRAEEVAKQQTSLKVVNKIKVKEGENY